MLFVFLLPLMLVNKEYQYVDRRAISLGDSSAHVTINFYHPLTFDTPYEDPIKLDFEYAWSSFSWIISLHRFMCQSASAEVDESQATSEALRHSFSG